MEGMEETPLHSPPALVTNEKSNEVEGEKKIFCQLPDHADTLSTSAAGDQKTQKFCRAGIVGLDGRKLVDGTMLTWAITGRNVKAVAEAEAASALVKA
ncbi:hypothetical protein CVT26_014213 [Gymnopilus dilepis]|uniref:Uncharacterized protein n=1 Tax=Gymnopilus dilepis TaxID=231916 RepID=A0A409VUA3_9AGAR|nr:hypothetical protein CVT26_014213 [Gymnopilus dilepis]